MDSAVNKNTLRIIVAGSRTFGDYGLLKRKLFEYLKDKDLVNIEIVSGMAKGADQLGYSFANQYHINCTKFPADWEKYGKSAGFRRNEEMADYAMAEGNGVLIAFWDGESHGTEHMIKLAKDKGMEVIVVDI